MRFLEMGKHKVVSESSGPFGGRGESSGQSRDFLFRRGRKVKIHGDGGFFDLHRTLGPDQSDIYPWLGDVPGEY